MLPDFKELAPGLLVTACVIAVIALIYAYWRTGITQASFTALYGFITFRAVHVPLVIVVGCFLLGYGLREAFNYSSSKPTLREMTTKDIEKIVAEAKKAELDGAGTQKMIEAFAAQVNKENESVVAMSKTTPEPVKESPMIPLSVSFGLMFSGLGLCGSSFYLIFRTAPQGNNP